MDLVTIVIPVYNRPALLRRAVASALAQTYRPIEIVIVDDGSTDETPQVAAELERAHDEVIVIRQPNGGPGAARETGRSAARGAFVQYLDSDDLLLSHKLELQMRALAAAPRAGAAYGRTRYRDRDGNEIACTWKPLLAGETAILPHFLRGRLWETVSPLYRAAAVDAAGPWTSRRLEEDWEYDCRVGALAIELVFVPEIVAEHRDDAADRLSRGEALDPQRLRDRAAAHESIYASAQRAGIGNDAPEMRHFARELFLLARQCGAAGLPAESRRLFELARAASEARGRAQFRAYATLARLVGWTRAGKLACLSDRLRW
ncbi:MAG TPA: glycosyltransferase family A protein [Thermoanaerobaculia bacterium]|jgi:glycosyltransferase involved in cell wall biosynthesis